MAGPRDDWRPRAEALLGERGTATLDHPGGLLLPHLQRVARILEEWGAHEVLQAAALCHACYGTDGFPVPLMTLEERPRLADAIGAEAEALVYRYASCDRAATYPRIGSTSPLVLTDRFTGLTEALDDDDAARFLELTAANELDIVRVNRDAALAWGPGFESFLRGAPQWLTAHALEAWRQAVTGEDGLVHPIRR